MKSPLQKIAEIDQTFGSPGLAHTMQTLGDQYDELDAETQLAYDKFYTEINNYVLGKS